MTDAAASSGEVVDGEATPGERFARALAVKDFEAIAALLHPEIDFKGMTPSRFWEAHSPDEVIHGVLQL